MFAYWGRRGFVRFALDLSRAALAYPTLATCVSVSKQNEDFDAFAALGSSLFPIETFHSNLGPLTRAWRIPALHKRLVRRLRQDRIQAIIDLMPHVWSPVLISATRWTGASYACIVHDADPHPGDWTAPVRMLSHSVVARADRVLTLSQAVADRLSATRQVEPARVASLFYPDLSYARRPVPRRREPDRPLRVLFLGRVMSYKGLPLFVEAVESLRAEGLAIEAGVFGEGQLGPEAERLMWLRSEVVNRWLGDSEIEDVLGRYDVVVASHVEASQSGVIGVALGAGLPVVATPVGGLVEQVADGVTGTLATRVDARALAVAIRRLADPELYAIVAENIVRTRERRSMERFVRACVENVTGTVSVTGRGPSQKPCRIGTRCREGRKSLG